jgi:SAM-dependent methyltransferase
MEDPNAQTVVGLNNAILASRGIRLQKDAAILDFGCGSGRFTYEYLDSGFTSVSGYDVANYVNLRKPEDISRFRFDDSGGAVGTYPSMSKIPWPDNSFDFIFATSVFEHVIDQEIAFREIQRVLKTGGYFLNQFPSKWRPIEPHIHVPFGAAIQFRWWFRLWAALGIRKMSINRGRRRKKPQV